MDGIAIFVQDFKVFVSHIQASSQSHQIFLTSVIAVLEAQTLRGISNILFFAQSKSICNLSNIFQGTFNEKENNHDLQLSTTKTTEALPKSLSEKSLEEFDCAELEIFLREIKAERENLYSLIQEQKDEIDYLYKIEALDIFFKSY